MKILELLNKFEYLYRITIRLKYKENAVINYSGKELLIDKEFEVLDWQVILGEEMYFHDTTLVIYVSEKDYLTLKGEQLQMIEKHNQITREIIQLRNKINSLSIERDKLEDVIVNNEECEEDENDK